MKIQNGAAAGMTLGEWRKHVAELGDVALLVQQLSGSSALHALQTLEASDRTVLPKMIAALEITGGVVAAEVRRRRLPAIEDLDVSALQPTPAAALLMSDMEKITGGGRTDIRDRTVQLVVDLYAHTVARDAGKTDSPTWQPDFAKFAPPRDHVANAHFEASPVTDSVMYGFRFHTKAQRDAFLESAKPFEQIGFKAGPMTEAWLARLKWLEPVPSIARRIREEVARRTVFSPSDTATQLLVEAATTFEELEAAARTWSHAEDCAGWAGEDGAGFGEDEPGSDNGPDRLECDCGVGEVIRYCRPAARVYVSHDDGDSIVIDTTGGQP